MRSLLALTNVKEFRFLSLQNIYFTVHQSMSFSSKSHSYFPSRILCECCFSHSTPLPTPTHKYNEWVSGRKSMGLTPLARAKEEEGGGGGGGGGRERGGEKEPMQFKNEAEREEWEEEQKVSVTKILGISVKTPYCLSFSLFPSPFSSTYVLIAKEKTLYKSQTVIRLSCLGYSILRCYAPINVLPSFVSLSKRLDRAWYDYEGGYDISHNDLAAIPEEYTKKKEEQLAKNTVKRMSAQQRQINKVCLDLFRISSRNRWPYL